MREIVCLIVFDEFHHVLNRDDQIKDNKIRTFIYQLLTADFGSRIILTSRYRPKLDEKYEGYSLSREIKGLTETDGMDLLRARNLKADGKTLRHICKRVAGHPHALQMFTTLTKRIPIENLLKGNYFGKRCSDKLLKEIYDSILSEDERQLLISSSVYRRAVPFEGLMALNGTIELIESLADKFLYEFDRENHLYRQHPIVTHFAYYRLEGSEKLLKQSHTKAAAFYNRRLSSKKISLEMVQDYIERHYHYRRARDQEMTIKTAIDSFDELRDIAREYYKQNEFQGAEMAYQAALELDELNGEANFYYALLLDKRNVEFIKVEHYFKEALKHDYKPHFVCVYGEFLWKHKKIKEARECFDRGIKKFRKDHNLYSVYARLEIDSNRIDLSIDIYKKAISSLPKAAQFYLEYARLLIKERDSEDRKDRFEDVVEVYIQGINCNPDAHEIYVAYGELLQQLEEFEEAKKLYEKGLVANPNQHDIYMAYGELLQHFGEIDKAKQLFENGMMIGQLKDDPTSFVRYCTFVYSIEWREKYQEIEDILKKGIKRHPSYYTNYALLKAAQGRINEAEELFKKGITLYKSYFPYLKYAQFLLQQGRLSEARELCKAGLELNPENEHLLQFSGELSGDVEETLTSNSSIKSVDSKKITWLHLSDLHFGKSGEYDENIVFKALLLDITECVKNYNIKPDIIFITGDIAFSGQSSQYSLAGHLFDELLKRTGLPKNLLFIVPGNHDVRRELITDGAKTIGASLTDRDKVNKLLATPDDRRIILSRFKDYAEFVNTYFSGHLSFNDENYFYAQTIELQGKRISIMGMNSALLAASKEDKSQGMIIGELQTRSALDLSEKADSDMKIALLHHSFDWLREFDQTYSAALLINKCDFILHGHLHKASLNCHANPDANSMIIAAGASYETRDYPNSYNFVELDLNAATGRVLLRSYSDQQGGFWAKDTLTYQNVKDGEYTFKLNFPFTQNKNMDDPPIQISQRKEYPLNQIPVSHSASTPQNDFRTLCVRPEMRNLLDTVFDDPDLDAFCSDYFSNDVYNKFGRGMQKTEKLTTLLNYSYATGKRFQDLLCAMDHLNKPDIQEFLKMKGIYQT